MNFFPTIRLEEAQKHRASVAALVASNALPVLGVVALGWRAFDIVFIYWLENVVIGAVNVLKIITCAPSKDELAAEIASKAGQERHDAEELLAETEQKFGTATIHATKLFFAPFFAVHYGGFCLVHGLFVCVLLGSDDLSDLDNPFTIARDALSDPWLLLAAAGLGASHLVSYFTNFLGAGEYRRTSPPLLMAQPYGRVVVLHIAIVLSGFFVVSLGSNLWLLLLLMIGKTWLDLGLHLREHADAGADEKGAEPTPAPGDPL